RGLRRFHVERIARLRELRRHPHVADVILQAWRKHGVGHVSDTALAFVHGPELGQFPIQRLTLEFDAYQLVLHAAPADLLQCCLCRLRGDTVSSSGSTYFTPSVHAPDPDMPVVSGSIAVPLHSC